MRLNVVLENSIENLVVFKILLEFLEIKLTLLVGRS